MPLKTKPDVNSTSSTMRPMLSKYAELLDERLSLGRRTKEDEARYTFYCAALATGAYRHTDISLEIPHTGLAGRKEIDTVLEPRDGRPAYALEFKFDQIPVCGAQNKTNRAGAVFNDMCRLAWAAFPRPTKTFFVYVTDRSMDVYFRNPKHGLHTFYDPLDGEVFSISKTFWATRPASFMSHVPTAHVDFSTSLFFSRELVCGFSIRVFEVFKPPSAEPNVG